MTETDNRLYRIIAEIERGLDCHYHLQSGLDREEFISQELGWLRNDGTSRHQDSRRDPRRNA